MISFTFVLVLAAAILFIVGAFEFVCNCFIAVLSVLLSIVGSLFAFVCHHWFAILLAIIVLCTVF